MSIVIINHHGIIKKYGYTHHRHYKLGNTISGKGIDYSLISSSLRQNNQKYIHNKVIEKDNVNGNFTFYSIKSKPKYKNNFIRLLNYLDFAFKVSKMKFNEPPEHIVGSSVHPFTWIAAYKLSKKYNSKFHIEIRDIWPLSLYEDLNGIQRSLVFKIFNMLEKTYYPLAKSIIVTAPQAHEYLIKKYNIEENKIHYIPHSIDINKFNDDVVNNEYTKIDEFFKDKFNITYTGSISSSEGLTNLLKLAKDLEDDKEIMIHIFGGGAEEQNLEKLIKKFHLKNVRMYGYIKADYIPYILSKSDLLWVGLKERKAFKYGISKNKFYEYIASKNPIIFHSNVQYSPLNDVDNAYIFPLNESPKEIVLDIKNGKVDKFDSMRFLEKNHSDEVIAEKFLESLK